MQRGKLWMLAGCVVILGACSDSPSALKPAPTTASFLVTPPGNLDQSVLAILSLYPKGLETAATTRWSNIKSKYAAGLKDPAQMAVAKSMLAELTDWLGKKTPDMATPPDGETRTSATARAVLYMSMYVFNGPAATPPAYSPTADAVTGLVTPGAPATIVTPTKHAGVQLEAGSVDETTIIVITQNLTPYPDNCSGPLQTKLCQYPQFYTFEQFPHKTLLKPAKFNACHINAGESRRPLADHDRFRLAHSKPANPADYTPGSVIRDQNGESIEILPLVPQTFSTCEGNAYGTETIGSASTSMVSRLARAVKKIVTPRTAYAIDLGLGGLSRSFSDFNDVDPLGQPDLSIDSMAVGQTVNHPGDQMSLGVVVSNLGTATKSAGQGIVYLTPPAPVVIEGPPQQPVDVQVATVAFPAIAPGSADTVNNVQFTLPSNIASGTYQVKIVVGNDAVLGDVSAANNTAIRSINVDGGIVDLGTLPGDDASVGYAINDAGHAVGYSIGSTTRPFLWVNGTMTSLGTLGGRAWAQDINNNDEVVGYSELANGELRAFLWKNGTMTNLGTLPGTNSSIAVGINSSGQIAGYSYNTATAGSSPTRAWIWQNGVMTTIDLPPGYSSSAAYAISDAGQVVGAAYSDEPRAVAWIWQNGVTSVVNSLGNQAEAIGVGENGTVVGDYTDVLSNPEWQAFVAADGFTPLPTLAGDVGGEAHAISGDGTIVGLSYRRIAENSYEFHAAMWRNGQPVNLGTLGGTTGWPLGINNLDQVIGYSTNTDNKNRATIWNVAPPPVIQ
ncbi:MAG TPA: hypothetical protein VFK26_05345 [Gemmatimonadaceae bacterium]|nr:hypothetical protein [Gemmatimonadaceae bacterium]